MSYDVTSIDDRFLSSIHQSYGQAAPAAAHNQAQGPAKAADNAAEKQDDASGKSFEQTLFGDDGLTFEDVLDTINPLQHLPIVNSVYREATGDELSGASRMAGGTLYGGVFGLIGSAVNWLIEEATGDDIGGHVMTAMGFGDEETPSEIQKAATDPDLSSAQGLGFDTATTAAPEPLTITGRPSAETSPAAPTFTPARFDSMAPQTDPAALSTATQTQQAFLADPIAFLMGEAQAAQVPKATQGPVVPQGSAASASPTPLTSDAGRIGVWSHGDFELPPVFGGQPAAQQAASESGTSLTATQLQALRAYQADMRQVQLALEDSQLP